MQRNPVSTHLELRWETLLSSCDVVLGVPIEFQRDSQASSRVEAWNFALLSSCEMGFRPPVELRWGNRDFS